MLGIERLGTRDEGRKWGGEVTRSMGHEVRRRGKGLRVWVWLEHSEK